MGLIGQVKCGRCDRKYSALRGRCPYCGARKNKGGKRSQSGNNKWQLIVGLVVLAVIIITVIIVIISSLSGKSKNKDKNTETTGNNTNSSFTDIIKQQNEGVSSAEGTPANTEGTQTGTGTETQTGTQTGTGTETQTGTTTPPAPTVTSITLNRSDFTLSQIGETWQMKATVLPANSGAEVEWSSENEKVCVISSTGVVTAVDKGTTNIVCKAGGKEAKCIVRVTASAPAGSTAPSAETGGITLSSTDFTLNISKGWTAYKITVSGATGTPTFSSSNNAVATVDANGNVTAIGKGTATITVKVDGKTLTAIARVAG